MKKLLLLICIALFACTSVYAADYGIISAPSADAVVNIMKEKQHPYLLGSSEDFDTLKGYLKTDSKFIDDFNLFKRRARVDLAASKNAAISSLDDFYTYGENKIIEYAFIYLMTGETEFADCAVDLMVKALDVDWRHSNTIETASTSMVYAICYDWLYDYMGDSEERRAIENGVWEKSLKYAYGLYSGGDYGEMKSWAEDCEHNWNVVCNSGFGAASLAFINALDGEKCAYMVTTGLTRVQNALSQISENGGWGEGIGYSQYGFLHFFKYAAMLMETMEDDFGLMSHIPLIKNILFPVYMTGTSQKAFNNHDGGDAYPDMLQLMFAAKYSNMKYAAIREHTLKSAAIEAGVFDLLWYVPANGEPQLSVDGFFDSYASMRTSFDTNDGIYAAIHGGQNNVNHGALDGGTFTLDALGERFVTCFGGGSYQLPGYHDRTEGGMRWNYYRLRAEGANTLVINPGYEADQIYNATTTLTHKGLNGDNPSVTADMTSAYPDAQSVKRTLSLTDNRKNARLTDVISLKKESTVYWFMHTKAEITLSDDGKSASLTQNNKTLNIKLVSPSNGVFTVMDALPLETSPNPDGQGTNSGYKKLAIKLTNVKSTAISVKFMPEYTKCTDITKNKSYIINEDFEDEAKITKHDSKGNMRIGPFTGTVNTKSDYKEIEVAEAGYKDKALRLHFVKDTASGVEKISGGVRLFSDNGTFYPEGTTVIDFNIKQRNVFDFKLEGRFAPSSYTSLFIIRGGCAAYYDNGKYVELMPLGNEYNRVRLILEEETRRLTVIINNKIIHKTTFHFPTGYKDKAVFRMTLTGGTEYVPGGKNLYTGEVCIGDFNIYRTDAVFNGETVIEREGNNSVRFAHFGDESFEADAYLAHYDTNTLLAVEKEKVSQTPGSEGYAVFNQATDDGILYVWDKDMSPVFEVLE